jgi:2-oxoglutarate ferredoxin oxidoreductase subunit beta
MVETLNSTVFRKPAALAEKVTHYCPGCTHGVIHRMVGEALDELGVTGKAVGVAPVGCSVLIYHYFECDFQEAAHGRAPAFATGIKRVRPDLVVFTYQGDGDLCSIGMSEIIHAANRGEKFTTIFVNNAIYGMTGGQMAPTTLSNQVTSTCPHGRDTEATGQPIKMAELLSALVTPAYIERVSVHDARHAIQAKKAVRRAFQHQIDGDCFSMVEILSNCPTNWGLTPLESIKWLEENMIPFFPLGVYKEPPAREG